MDLNAAMAGTNGAGIPASGIDAFDAAAAPEFTPVPPGIYAATVVKGEFCTTRAGADAYRMRFVISDGPQTGRTLIRTWTFSPKALPYSKRDLAVFGLATSAQLLSPFPPPGREYHVRLVVALQAGDDGVTRNDLKRIDLVRVVESPAAAFMLPAEGEGGTV